jgi:hypothetical protein
MLRKKQPKTPRDDLMAEILGQFPEITLLKGEDVEKRLKELILLTSKENITDTEERLIDSKNSLHPNLEIIMEKFDAKVSPLRTSEDDSVDFIISPDYKSGKTQRKKETGFFIFKELLKKFKS